ncbi:ornithine--oxo-acid transaminase [Myceligenerans salitolerans]|uniref:ornithine aminotransferase n=1 Tax=Myceligenerans salitolerans TaxID=1230528 RepID=A0ABS3I8S3_9MICO|nr:ornithine--oxo-acid transaminase [Myceligenerans salitolerans]MBO0609408.1 ornithine--oxo-acid transaminase [Myceligenerans salitolerans]
MAEPRDTVEGSALAPNYGPLPLTVARAQGVYVWDVDGDAYLDFLAGYSALNFGHLHQALVSAAIGQLKHLTLTSRAVGHELLEPFARRTADVVGPLTTGGPESLVVPMNTGAEAVETAIKAVRKRGYDTKGIAEDEANIVVASGNSHGRTTTLAGLSDNPVARDRFGPFTPGFRTVPFGDADAVAGALDDATVAILMEPVQGEAGVVVPPEDFWPRLRELADEHDVVLVADEIQSGLGRTGHVLACELWDTTPDLAVLGNSLGGGIVPVSAVVGRRDVLATLTPGTHGSTFGGNPLACAVAIAVLDLLAPGQYQARAVQLGTELREHLQRLTDDGLLAGFRAAGLWAGLDLDPARNPGLDHPARALSEELLERGVLTYETRGNTIRLSPPLSIARPELDHAMEILELSLRALAEPDTTPVAEPDTAAVTPRRAPQQPPAART